MSRTRIEEIDGDIRFHHIRPGVWVLDARRCAHRWVVFHETYSFCCVELIPDQPVVRWRYNHRIFQVDPLRPLMLMQPGELHSNVDRTPRGDFIVLQITEEAMSRMASELGWRGKAPNIKPPHQHSNHPAMLAALRRLRAGLCSELFSSPSGRCGCGARADHQLTNVLEVVDAFLRHCAERDREFVLPRRGPAFVARAKAYLYENRTLPFKLSNLANEVGCSEDYLLHTFREEVGVSPQDFQNRVLVAHALNVLAQKPDLTLASIAAEVGWPGRVHDDGADRARLLIRHLKRSIGATPDAFRRDLRPLRSRTDRTRTAD